MIFPDGVTEQAFVEQYWQRRALLITQGLEGVESLITKAELFELAADDCVESRLVSYNSSREEYKLRHGPFTALELQALADEEPWTLLVQSVNLWHESVARLIAHVMFIPHWRYDDIMISYASPGGGVGPHTDQYDVFLVQISGQRRWRVGEQNQSVEANATENELQLIAPFDATIDAVLRPGDIMYVPPDTPHEGISNTSGMTLSIGFRSPSSSELSMMLAEEISIDDSYYRDPAEVAIQNCTEITAAAMTQVKDWFINSINEQQIYIAFGKLQTQPKQDLILLPLEKPIEELLERGNLIERDPAARIAWWQSGPVIHLFCNGEHGVFSYTDKALITLVSETQNIALATVSSYIQQKACKQLLIFLADVGYYGTSEY